MAQKSETELDLTFHTMLCDLLKEHASKWRDIGRNLGFLPGELNNIQGKPLLLQNAPESWLKALLEKFLKGDFKSVQDGDNSSTLVTALNKAGLGGTAIQIQTEVQQLQEKTSKETNTRQQIPQSSKRQSMCDIHNEPKEIYCSPCNFMLCKKCLQINHRGHRHDNLQKIAPFFKSHMKCELKLLKEKQEILSKTKETLQITWTEIQHQGELIKQSIGKSFQELHTILEQHQERLITEASKKVDEKLSCLSEQQKSLNTTIASLKSLESEVEQKFASDEEFMLTYKKMYSKITQQTERISYVQDTPAVIADLKVDISCAKKINEVCEDCTQIYHMADPSKCTVDGPALEGVEVCKQSHVTLHLKLHDDMPIEKPQIVSTTFKTLAKWNQIAVIQDEERFILETDSKNIDVYSSIRGRLQLSIDVNSKGIHGSPFLFFVSIPPTELGKPVGTIKGVEEPMGVTVNSANELIVCGRGTIARFRINSGLDGQKITEIQRHNLGNGHLLTSVVTDKDDNIYVTDCTSHCLIKITKDGRQIITGRMGTRSGEFRNPMGVTVSDDRVHVCDMHNKRIQILDAKTLHQHDTIIDCKRSSPHSIARDKGGKTYVVNKQFKQVTNSITVYSYRTYAKRLSVLQTKKYTLGMLPVPYMLQDPAGICVHNNYVYVVEKSENRVSVFDKDGRHDISFGKKGKKEGQFHNPTGICADHDGFIYVCDTGNNRIQVF